jgi:signal transduction histidine kinase/DNA-binding NarL/FixJ family response regulator
VALAASAVFVVGAVAEVGEALFSNIALFIAIYTVGAWGRSRLRRERRAGRHRRRHVRVAVLGADSSARCRQSTLPDVSREGRRLAVHRRLAHQRAHEPALLRRRLVLRRRRTARHAARSALEQRTEELAAERERTREQAVAIERLRIARELHDVVAHHVSVIGVQAGAPGACSRRDPTMPPPRRSPRSSHSAREAVAELHGLLGTLRGARAATWLRRHRDAPSEPVPHGLDDLPGLVAESSASGVPTTLGVIGTPRATSGLVGITAYRLVQEALTNVRKHAGAGATADVRVRWADDALELEVSDTGSARSASARPGGLGHAGMRERVSAVGGELELGARQAAAATSCARPCRCDASERLVTIRVLVVDDQALVRGGFSTILDSEPGIEVVGEAADGAAADRRGGRAPLPTWCAWTCRCPASTASPPPRRIAREHGDRPGRARAHDVQPRGLPLPGARGRCERVPAEELEPRAAHRGVQVVARGDALLSPDVTRRVIEAAWRHLGPCADPRADAGFGAVSRDELASSPTASARCSSCSPKGISNAEIAQRLWVGEATVKTHVSKVLHEARPPRSRARGRLRVRARRGAALDLSCGPYPTATGPRR